MQCRVGFVADLHLFTRRSHAHRYQESMRGAADRSAAFVLGGDIFDFRWSTLATTSATIDAALDWLEALTAAHPHCHFHYLLGNHDYCQSFLHRLEERAGQMPNFSWHRFYLRLGDSVFLHGDAAERRMTPEKLIQFRSRWLHVKPPSRLHRHAYDLVHHIGLHRPIPFLFNTKRRVARQILDYLERIGEGPATGLRHVYFGHIHRRVSNYRYHGLTFHNGGAPIAGGRFRILETLVQMNEG